jgi:HlyD family secretion protein
MAVLCLTLLVASACSGGSQAGVSQQLVKVERGDLTVTVSGSGNIEVSNKMSLTFGTGGQVEKIYIDEGDRVSKGQELAKLKTDSLELVLAQAEAAYAQAQVGITQAQLNLKSAEFDLEKTEDLFVRPDDIFAARQAVRVAEANLENAKEQLSNATLEWDIKVWTNEVKIAEENLRKAQAALEALLSASVDPEREEVQIKRLQVQVAQQSVELAQHSFEMAEKSLEIARKQLDEATIKAPFDSVVAKVSVDEMDIVLATTQIIQVIDPASMQLKVQVDEVDVPKVKIGQKTVIEVDALPDVKIEGRVTFVSLIPGQAAGVTVYDVKVEFSTAESSELRIGMSATADIVIAERTDVLLVPDRAITKNKQGESVVEVMVNGKAETRTVVTGVSDGLQTEIIGGLQEGDEVIERRTQSSSGMGMF